MRIITEKRMRRFYHFTLITFLKTIWSIQLLSAGNRRWTKLFLRSLRYWRVLEFPFVLHNLPRKSKLKVLDISSPKMLSFYIANRLDHHVTAIDIWDEEVSMWQTFQSSLRSTRGLSENILLQVEDGTNLSFPSNSFDVVYSVSVIEHIDSTGDSEAMREIGRVLRPGGTALVTVMFDEKGYEVFRTENVYHKKFDEEPVFYERWYSEEQIMSRLVEPSGLELAGRTFIKECLPAHKNLVDRFTRSTSFIVSNSWSLIEPIVALLNLRLCGEKPDEGVVMLKLRKKKDPAKNPG